MKVSIPPLPIGVWIGGAALGGSVLVLGAALLSSMQPKAKPQAPVAQPAAEQQQQPAIAGNTLKVEYQQSGRYVQERVLLERSRVLEQGSLMLQSLIKLNPATIEVKECGTANAHYQQAPVTPLLPGQITICYELLREVINGNTARGMAPDKAAQTGLYLMLFALNHEVGHKVIREFNLPFTGSEEDAADEFAVMILTQQGKDKPVKAAILQQAQSEDVAGTDLNTEYRTATQRKFFNTCLLYGSDPEKHEVLATQLGFTSDRRAECTEKYDRALSNWLKFLEPYKQ